jgi:Uri superfamily endonuclease
MELPDKKGTYILIASILQMKRLKIGRLGTYDLLPGFYAYVGSAFGPGGIRARIHHHLELVADPKGHTRPRLALLCPG